MKYKQKVDIVIALLLIITGSVILTLPLFEVNCKVAPDLELKSLS